MEYIFTPEQLDAANASVGSFPQTVKSKIWEAFGIPTSEKEDFMLDWNGAHGLSEFKIGYFFNDQDLQINLVINEQAGAFSKVWPKLVNVCKTNGVKTISLIDHSVTRNDPWIRYGFDGAHRQRDFRKVIL